MRTRTRGADYEVPLKWNGRSTSRSYQITSGPPPRLADPALTIVGKARHSDLGVMTDVITPDYYKRVKEGKLPVNPCTSEQRETVGGVGRFYFYSYLDRETTNPDLRARSENVLIYDGALPLTAPFGSLNPPPINTGALMTEAVARARSELWDVGTTAAEMGKTVSMIMGLQRKNFKRMDKILLEMTSRKRASRANLAGLADEFSQLWLSGRYGWRPLAYDYQNAQSAIEKTLSGLFVHTRKYASETTSLSHESNWTKLAQNVEYRWTTMSTRTARAFVGMEASGAAAYIDPLVTAWELVPFSFVIDWFFNIGANISAYSPTATGKVAWAGVSNEIETVRTLEYRHTGTTTYTEKQVQPFSTITRSYNRGPETPGVSFAFRPNFDGFKAADLMALTLQALLRKSNAFRKIIGLTSGRPKGR